MGISIVALLALKGMERRPHGLPTGACARAMVALPSGSPLSSRKVEADNRVTVPGMAPKRTAASQVIEPGD